MCVVFFPNKYLSLCLNRGGQSDATWTVHGHGFAGATRSGKRGTTDGLELERSKRAPLKGYIGGGGGGTMRGGGFRGWTQSVVNCNLRRRRRLRERRAILVSGTTIITKNIHTVTGLRRPGVVEGGKIWFLTNEGGLIQPYIINTISESTVGRQNFVTYLNF